MTDQTPSEDRPTGPVDGVHPDIDELSAYAAGELAGDRAARVGSHVGTCEGCAADLDALVAVTHDLGAVPVLAMPADVASRLEAAIRREREGLQEASTPTRVTARRGTPTWAAVAAGTAVIALAGAVVAGVVSSDRTNSKTGVPASAARGDSNLESSNGAARDRAATGAPPVPPADTTASASAADGSSVVAVRATGTDYRREQGAFAGQVRASLRLPARASLTRVSGQSYSAGSPPEADTLESQGLDVPLRSLISDGRRLPACVELLTGGEPATLVSVDLAKFLGRPAATLVFEGEAPGTLAVYVVRPDCGETDRDPQLHYEVVTGR